MRASDLPQTAWRKSSCSNGGVDGNCVEVAELADRIALRDSKDPDGPVLSFPRTEWHAFLNSTRTGQFG